MPEYVVGLDLGTRNDYTALAIAEVLAGEPRRYAVRHLERQRGRDYHELTAWVKDRLSRPPLGPSALARGVEALGHRPAAPPAVHVIIDETGVGIVLEILERAELGHPLTAVMITAGTATTRLSATRRHVAKAHLVSVIDATLDTSRLTMGRHVRDRETLIAELQGFRRKFTAAANETFGNGREARHDDLVLAVALAVWGGEHGPARPAGVWFLGGRSDIDPGTGEFRW
jgi:hypothetical protein